MLFLKIMWEYFFREMAWYLQLLVGWSTLNPPGRIELDIIPIVVRITWVNICAEYGHLTCPREHMLFKAEPKGSRGNRSETEKAQK